MSCAPTGDLRPWVDDRVKTCTLCAALVDERALADGSDWIAVDGAGQAFGSDPTPELCPCYPPGDPLRASPRHYGAGLRLTEFYRHHVHNAIGGEVYFTDLRVALPMACGHRATPPSVHTAVAEPLITDRACPECCGQPMRFAPRGWQCRVSLTYFVPDFESEPAHA